jgi:hypothetical protein
MAEIEITTVAERLFSWTLDTGDTGEPLTNLFIGGSAAVQVSGLSDSTLTFQASNDGTNWFTVSDMYENSIAITADALHEITTAAYYLRPSLSGGTDTDVVVTISLMG